MENVQRLLWLTAGSLVLGTSLLLAKEPAQEMDLAEVVELHRTLIAAKRLENDTTLLGRVALENYVVIPPGGLVETRDEAVRGVANFIGDSLNIVVDVVSGHDSTAVLVGTVGGNIGVRGPVPQFERVRFMAVYVRTEGAWRLLAQSNTPCLPKAIELGRC